MKYVYAILTVLEEKPMMQTLVSKKRLTGKEVLNKVVLSPKERTRYKDWDNELAILQDINKSMSVKVEIQEVEVD